jgi:hypothetical protein
LEGAQLELAKAQRAAYLETAKEVEAGKYASAREAMQACEQRRRETFAKFQPTTRPEDILPRK